MKIAISISQNNENSMVDERFGRAPYFLIYDTETKEKKIIDNTHNANAMQGAGVQTTQTILKEKIDAVITGHVGPKALQSLKISNIKIYTIKDRVDVNKAIELFEENKLSLI